MAERTVWTARTWALCLAVSLIWYPALTLLLGFAPADRMDFGLAFNSMAEHLLAGRFDVDPDAIGAEAFEVDGRTVSYFGPFCALLRIPLVLISGLARTNITWWSCLVAMGLAAWFQCRTIQLVWPSTGQPWSRRDWLAAGLLLSMLLAGPQVQFLRPSLFQEVVNWAFLQAMVFVFLAVRGVVSPRGFDGATLCQMAVCAGLALLTRASFGIGLYAALTFLLIVRGRTQPGFAPAGLLLVFVAAAGVVNYGRWGNPLVFADHARYALSQDYAPDRLVRLATYGAFNPVRIPLTLGYYFVPVWIWLRGDGHVLFAETQFRLMDAMELPPGSFFLTDPLLLALAVAGVFAVRDKVRLALLAGLALQPAVILCAISTAHRYRMDFYPFLFLAAVFALAAPGWRTPATPRFRHLVAACVILGIVMSHGMAFVYAWSPLGPGQAYLERYGLIGTYMRSWR